MKRWNGWGDESVNYPLPEGAGAFLEARLGTANPPQDVNFAEVVKQVPQSRLPEHPLIDTQPETRARYARGQSLPDWIAVRSGCIGAFPDGVAFPMNEDEVKSLLRYGAAAGVQLIPYGGGTSVVGHINPMAGDAPVLTVSMERMNQLLSFDEKSNLATFGAGVSGPDLEAQLRARGRTLGHFPQSFEYSTLGGWIATRSSGQQALHYGRIENLFAGGRVETPLGRLDLPPLPASAAGADIREMVLGSEGRMGIITQAVMRVSDVPEREDFYGVFFPDFDSGMAAVREIVQARIPLSMLRLSNAIETATTLALAGHERVINGLEKYLSWRGAKDEKCLLMVGFTGQKAVGKGAVKAALHIMGRYGGINIGTVLGNQWKKSRFRNPYLRNTVWEKGYAIDTVETAVHWSNTRQMMEAIESALKNASGDAPIHVFTHLSHTYPTGSSVYTTYVFHVLPDPEQMLAHWSKLKSAASEAITRTGGTISHQHGVGLDHLPYLAAEKGELGMKAIRTLYETFDPGRMMNPGKLLSEVGHVG